MKKSKWEIGLVGTFDVENYGDLLFPLLAEAELTERLGPVTLHRFSYNPKTPPDWPYEVTSLTELPRLVSRLDGLLIGGGFIIRFDKDVAAGYGPPTPAIHHPTGYWLTPALMALQHGVPVAWNAPGMHCNDIPQWADPLVKLAFSLSRYIAVRDLASRAALLPYADNSPIAVVPDTAFGITRLLGDKRSNEYVELCKAADLTGPYIIIQPSVCLDPFLGFVQNHAERFKDVRFLVLPIGPVLGDDVGLVGNHLPGLVHLDQWPHPLLLAELISRAEAAVGHSYHLAITALAFGVPVLTPQDLGIGKYSALLGFDGISSFIGKSASDPFWLNTRIGRTAPSAAARATLGQLGDHWDRIAEVIRDGPSDNQPAFNQFWQSLPGYMETAADSHRITVPGQARRAPALLRLALGKLKSFVRNGQQG